jgi:lipoprotein signal peptidase
MTVKYESCTYLENTGHLLSHHAQQPDFVLTLRLLSMGLGFYALLFQLLVQQKPPLRRKFQFKIIIIVR